MFSDLDLHIVGCHESGLILFSSRSYKAFKNRRDIVVLYKTIDLICVVDWSWSVASSRVSWFSRARRSRSLGSQTFDTIAQPTVNNLPSSVLEESINVCDDAFEQIKLELEETQEKCNFCDSKIKSYHYKGTWSNRPWVAAALNMPEVLGWSGTWERKMSRWFLKRRNSPELSYPRVIGSKLNRRAPLQAPLRVFSLACLTTLAGAPGGMLFWTASLPRLSFKCHLIG